MNAQQMLGKLKAYKGKEINYDKVKDLFSGYEEMGYTADDLNISVAKESPLVDCDRTQYIVGVERENTYLFKLISEKNKLKSVEICYSPVKELEKREPIISQLIDAKVIATLQELINYYVIQYGSISKAELIYLLDEFNKKEE